MTQDHRAPSRRSIIAGAGLLAGAAQAATTKSGPSSKIWSNEYWAKKGNVSLNMFRKRGVAPKAGEAPLPVLLLVHGSSNSSRTSFDLTVPGHGEYSVMNVFAQRGFDVW